jgi:hypothetical protein
MIEKGGRGIDDSFCALTKLIELIAVFDEIFPELFFFFLSGTF